MEHKLVFLPASPYSNGCFECNLCWEKGSGALYHCSSCHFSLHPLCVATQEQHTHFSHHHHPLYLASLPVNSPNTCDSCGEQASPQVYRCNRCDYDLHSHCVRAPRFLQHYSHDHILTLMPKESSGSDTLLCDGCGEEVTKMTYRCASCRFDLHPSCVMLPRKPLHPLHPAHPLLLFTKPTYSGRSYICDECGEKGTKWVYHCDTCSFDVHPQCAKILHELPPSSAADSHDDRSSTETHVSRHQRSSSWSRFGDVCPTCLEGYNRENPRRFTNCGHHFHHGCILKWLERNDTCPVCRCKCHVS